MAWKHRYCEALAQQDSQQFFEKGQKHYPNCNREGNVDITRSKKRRSFKLCGYGGCSSLIVADLLVL